MQSITVPLQGFLNALVYGWTREDFLVINKSNYNSKKTYGTVDVDDKSSMDEDEKELKMGTSAVNIMDVDITLPMELEESARYHETEMEDNDIDDK